MGRPRKKSIDERLREGKLTPDRANPADRGWDQLSPRDENRSGLSVTRTDYESYLEAEPTPQWERERAICLVVVHLIAQIKEWDSRTRDAALEPFQNAKPGCELLEFTPGSNRHSLGTPKEFLARWGRNEAQVFWKTSEKTKSIFIRIKLESIPPDETDEEDDGDPDRPGGYEVAGS